MSRNCGCGRSKRDCALPVVRVQNDHCKKPRGGTPTVKSPNYSLTVTKQDGGVNDDKPIDIPAV